MAELLRAGDQINRLIVLGEVGRGARGVVYRAYDPRLERNVALKLLHHQPRDRHDTARKRLVREAQAMAQLSHPNVVTVYDVGTVSVDGTVHVFVEMEFVAGRSLEQQIEAWHRAPRGLRRRRWSEIVATFIDAGEGLAAAHDRGLVHRDFKPANVLVDDSGRARVTDFGLARRMSDAARPAPPQGVEDSAASALDLPLTQTGALVGTPAYMAPEQFRGHEGDARVDQFAFCVALYEALYGQRPFPGEQLAELAHAVLHEPPRARPTDGPGVPRHVDRALVRGLHKDPEQRHPSMKALLEALRADPRVPLRRAVSTLGTLAGIAAVAFAVQRWLEPGVLVLSVGGAGLDHGTIGVTVDGSSVPLDRVQAGLPLPAGVHEIVVEADDHDPWRYAVELDRGQTRQLDAVLRHHKGLLRLEVVPQTASVDIDGADASSRELDTGTHQLRVSAPGTHDVRLALRVEPGQQTEATAYLAPALAFHERGRGLELDRGVLGDVDGDGMVDIWHVDHATMSAYSARSGRALWRRRLSQSVHTMFVRMTDIDSDDVVDPVVLGTDEHGAVLSVASGRDPLEPSWSRRSTAQQLPLVPPEIVTTGGESLVVVSGLVPGEVAAHVLTTGDLRWRAEVDPPVIGMVAGAEGHGGWLAIAHAGGVSTVETHDGARRWHAPVPSFDKGLLERLQHDHLLTHRGRKPGPGWMLAAPLDDQEGDDLVLPLLDHTLCGPLRGFSGRDGQPLWDGPVMRGLWPRLVDIDDDEHPDIEFEHPGEHRVLYVSGATGTRLGWLDPGEQLVRWPCDGPARLLGRDARGTYARSVDDAVPRARLEHVDRFDTVICSDWDGDDDDELVAIAPGRLRAYDEHGEVGAVTLDQVPVHIEPLGDIDDDARPDFLLSGGGPTVVLSSRIRWARSFGSTLTAAPSVVDLDGDGDVEIAIFDGNQEESMLEILAADDGERLARLPRAGFALRAPAVVPGSRPGTHDLVFASSRRGLYRVLGHDLSARRLDIGVESLEAYAGIGASIDGTLLWVTSWDAAPQLRGLRPRGDGGSPDDSWVISASFEAGRGGPARAQLAELDGAHGTEVLGVVDMARVVMLDGESGECQWSRWGGAARVDRAPTVVDLDGDGVYEVLLAGAIDAPERAPSCDRARESGRPASTPDLLAVGGADGRIRWRLPSGGSSLFPPVEVRTEDQRWLVAASEGLGLYAVGLDGQLSWSRPGVTEITAPLQVGDLNGDGRPELVHVSGRGNVQVRDAKTGALRWRWSAPDAQIQSAPPVLADLDGRGADELLLATGSGTLFVLDGP